MGNKDKKNTLTLSVAADESIDSKQVDETPPPSKADKAATKAPIVRAKKTRGGLFMGFVFLFLAMTVALSVAGYWGWEQFSLFKQSILQSIENNQQHLGTQKQQLTTLAQLAPELDATRRNIEKSISQSSLNQKNIEQVVSTSSLKQAQIKESIQALYNEMNKGRQHGWVVAESQYLINIANHRLYLAQDAEGAVAALKAADQRLRAVGDPSLLATRTAIADEISRLQSVRKIDTAGYSATLVSLQARVGDLKLPAPTATVGVQEQLPEKHWFGGTSADAEDWRNTAEKIAEKIAQSLNDLIKVRHKDGKEIPFIPPAQSHYLRQNIRLKLEVARLALVQKDPALFQASLHNVNAWVTQYFQQDAVRDAMLNQLQSLSELNLVITYPDISMSRKALKEWTTMQANNQGGSQ